MVFGLFLLLVATALIGRPESKMAPSSRYLGTTLRLSQLEVRMGHTEMAWKHPRAEDKF